MTCNEKFVNNGRIKGGINARMMAKARKSRKQNVLTRETIKQTVEDFFGEHEEKELVVTVSLDSSNRKAICNFHIGLQEREITEDSTKTELIISNYAPPLVSLIPDDVTIKYEEVIRCEATVKTGETEDDIVAHVLEIAFRNGTVMELGFLKI